MHLFTWILLLSDDESGERSVCVLLAGEESEITFLDSPPDHLVVSIHPGIVIQLEIPRATFALPELPRVDRCSHEVRSRIECDHRPPMAQQLAGPLRPFYA
ncbi:hypothetical protein EVAR_47513_1 [Eumeta japonica]|uniref:Uncharacterized protein n=1 Tax=Eumeta variegata TaxID=151549 RepID=A0A4C1XSI8_EUMVA|nr:hypothetical protein EVAR_47513_1 [Eumeta japonica]